MPINMYMSFRMKCYTLFDIQQTGVINRHRSADDINPEWTYKRNTQCNFDTILQVISMRSQPEIINSPKKIIGNTAFFGFAYTEETIECWAFEFDIQHASVFKNELGELGGLYLDCDGVPMILCGTENNKITSFLDISPELKNIHFEIL